MAHLIKEITKQRLRLVPDSSRSHTAENIQAEREFEIRVSNTSKIFASFQVELSINGADPNSKIQWYSVEPKVCSKKPPGDETKFNVVITKAPIPIYDTVIPLTLNVFSVDSEILFESQVLELSIEKPRRPLKVYLPLNDLKVYPGDKLEISVLIYNLSPKFTQVTLTLDELEPDWFVKQEVTKTVRVDAGDSQEVTFYCSPPRQTYTCSKVYDFSVRAEDQNGNSDRCFGKIEVLPYGIVKFDCLEPAQTIPHSQGTEAREVGVAHYPFQFTNTSNLKQQIFLKLLEARQPIPELEPPETLTVEPGATAKTIRKVSKPRPWLGRSRSHRLEAVPTLINANSGASSEPLYADPNVQILDLRVYPLIPFWLQLLSGVIGLLSLGLFWWLSSPKPLHLAPVNSVRIIGNETTVVSGASDQTVRRWDVNSSPWVVNQRRLSDRGIIANAEHTGKAVRVIREIPQREGQIAVGLENGKIQLWPVSSSQDNPFATIFDRSDRIFDLDFTPDSRSLFSGHGSGFIRRWERGTTGYTLTRQVAIGGAISSLVVIDLSATNPPRPNQSLVAIVGQYNKFMLWDGEETSPHQVRYGWNLVNSAADSIQISPVISKYDYINSVAAAKNSPVLAMADNRGFITVWDVNKLSQCTTSSLCNVAPREQWQANSGGQSVRSVALSDDGCYLASAGDDGRVMVWLIREELDRRQSHNHPNSILIAEFLSTTLRTVDIKHPAPDYVLVASNAPENQVKLYRQQVNPTDCSASAAP